MDSFYQITFAASASETPKLPSTAEMSELDRRTIKNGTPALELMERAGKAIFEEIRERSQGGRVLVLCGPGNNGGDGLVVARLLVQSGIESSVILTSAGRYSPELITNLKHLLELNASISVFGGDAEKIEKFQIEPIRPTEVAAKIQQSTVIVDALLGTGQNGPPRGPIATLVGLVLESRLKQELISIDVPTGTSGDSGEVWDPHLTASQTLAIQLIKRGSVQYPALEASGTIKTVAIGIDESTKIEFSAVTRHSIGPLFERDGGAHKGRFGHLLVVGGCRDMPGAPWLSAGAALKSGAGLVTKVELKSVREDWRGKVKDYDGRSNEIMLIELDDRGRGYLVPENLESIDLGTFSAVVVGPGLGQRLETASFLADLLGALARLKLPTIIDADALNIISQKPSAYKLGAHSILTPHPGEAARLLGRPTTEIQRDRYRSVADLVDTTGATVVLKGASTVIHNGEEGRVVLAGNPFMATAGSGDVLAGIIGSLAGITALSPLLAGAAGAYLHARAGDLAHATHNGPITASDIAEKIPQAIGECRE